MDKDEPALFSNGPLLFSNDPPLNSRGTRLINNDPALFVFRLESINVVLTSLVFGTALNVGETMLFEDVTMLINIGPTLDDGGSMSIIFRAVLNSARTMSSVFGPPSCDNEVMSADGSSLLISLEPPLNEPKATSINGETERSVGAHLLFVGDSVDAEHYFRLS